MRDMKTLESAARRKYVAPIGPKYPAEQLYVDVNISVDEWARRARVQDHGADKAALFRRHEAELPEEIVDDRARNLSLFPLLGP